MLQSKFSSELFFNCFKLLDMEKNCLVGLKDGRVQDGDLTASSEHGHGRLASFGRLDFDNYWVAGVSK